MKCFRCNKEFYSEDIGRNLCYECLGRNNIIKTSHLEQILPFDANPQMAFENVLLVEDGSVDTQKLDEMGIKYIVYRAGSQKPEIIKIWESLK